MAGSEKRVHLYCGLRADAERAAAALEAEGLRGELVQNRIGRGWQVAASGAPDAVALLVDRLKKSLG